MLNTLFSYIWFFFLIGCSPKDAVVDAFDVTLNHMVATIDAFDELLNPWVYLLGLGSMLMVVLYFLFIGYCYSFFLF